MLADKGMDIRKEFEQLLKEFSIDVLYIRATKYIRCKCFNMLHQTGDPDCNICFGNGHITTIEKLETIVQGLQTQSPASSMKITEIGMSSSPSLAFFMDYTKNPKVKDTIVVTGWNKKGQPQDVKKVCVISSVDEIRGDNGRIELYSCTATVRPELYYQIQKIIGKLDNAAKNTIAVGRKYIWPLQK